jgi:hypothetical protein
MVESAADYWMAQPQKQQPQQKHSGGRKVCNIS